MALRDTSWIWDTTTADFKYANAKIVKSSQGVQKYEGRDLQNWRTIDNATYKWFAVTKAAAISAALKAEGITFKSKMTKIKLDNMIVGSYSVTVENNGSDGWQNG